MDARVAGWIDPTQIGGTVAQNLIWAVGRCAASRRGVMEMREHFGPGWRMYYVQHASVIIVMLGGGDKSSQTGDIAKAQTLAQQLE